MPDYNLGRAHGTIRIDYDGSGADEARRDVNDLGDDAVRTGTKIDNTNKEVSRSYRRLGQEASKTDITPDVDTSQLSQFVNHLRQIQSNTSKSSSLLNTFSGRMRLIVAGVAIATPGIAGLGVALASLAGLAGVAAGALASLAAVGGTVATGMSGVGDAFKAASQQAKAAGGSAGASAKAQRAAARSIEDAKRSLADAEENLRRAQEDAARAVAQALKQVINAQRDLEDAQRDAIRAQEQLNQARRQARRDLEDLQFALTGGSLDERQAILDVKKAQEELNKVLKDPTANANDIEQATLNLEKQQLALEETRKANERLRTDATEAAQAGVEGSAQVVSAQDGVRSATQSVVQAQESLAEAQDNVRQVQVDSARQIADAVQSVIDAQRNLQEAYLDASDAGSAAGAKLNDAMDNLSPNARAFVQEVLNLKGAWDSVRKSVQDKLFEGLAAEVQPLAQQWFPLLQQGMGQVATSLNGIVKETVAYLHTAEAQKNVQGIFHNTGVALSNMKGIVRDLLAAFLDIANVGSEFLPGLASGAANAAARFREFIDAAQQSGKLREWMQSAMDTASQLWQLLSNLGTIIGTVFSALDQQGGGALNTLTALTGQVAAFLQGAEGQEALQALGRALAAIGGAYGKVFMSFLTVAADLLVSIEPLITAFADAAGTYLAVALQALGVVLKPIADLLGFLGPALGPVVAGIYAANKAVAAAKLAWGALNVVMNANPFLVIAAAIITLVILIIQNWDSIVAALETAWNWIKDLANTIWTAIADFFKGIWNNITEGISNTWNGIKEFLSNVWNGIKQQASAAWNAFLDLIQGIFDNLGTAAGDAVRSVIDFFRELPGKVWNFLKELPGKMLQLGKDIVSGILRGLSNLASAIWNKLKQAVSDAWDSVLSFFGISSPSKLAAEAGRNIVAGLAQGIEKSADVAVTAATAMAEAVGGELTGSTSALAATVSMGADTSGLPNNFAIDAAMNSFGGTTPVRGSDGAAAGGRTVIIEKVEVYVQGNLDPTNPTAYRQTMVRLKNDLRSLDKEYA